VAPHPRPVRRARTCALCPCASAPSIGRSSTIGWCPRPWCPHLVTATGLARPVAAGAAYPVRHHSPGWPVRRQFDRSPLDQRHSPRHGSSARLGSPARVRPQRHPHSQRHRPHPARITCGHRRESGSDDERQQAARGPAFHRRAHREQRGLPGDWRAPSKSTPHTRVDRTSPVIRSTGASRNSSDTPPPDR
jgi:hypothetical protein